MVRSDFRPPLWLIGLAILLLAFAPARHASAQPPTPQPAPTPIKGLKVGRFPVDVRTAYTVADGLPSNDVFDVAVLPSGDVYVGTAKGIARFDGRRWKSVGLATSPVTRLAPGAQGLFALVDQKLVQAHGDSIEPRGETPGDLGEVIALQASSNHERLFLASRSGVFEQSKSGFRPEPAFNGVAGDKPHIHQIAVAADGRLAVAAESGLFLFDPHTAWSQLNPAQNDQSWLPRNVGGVAFDSRGRLWFASRQGVGVLDGRKWTLYTGLDGLPYNDFTTLCAGDNGIVWFGTTRGAIRFDGKNWSYRQGKRWVPDDEIRQIAIAADGTAWFATKAGVGKIEPRMMTLAEKARLFEEEIDKFHRRTPYGFVDAVYVAAPGDATHITQRDNDNDGLWTAMYGAGEAFAYAATKDPKAKERVTRAFHALRFLSQVTQGGEHPAPKGFPARTVLPTSGPNPNLHNTEENDRRFNSRDSLWKVIVPRWPKSADGKWYWKCDTSSDELDGHYLLYATYYDLVAETEEEKREAREVIAALTDHLLEHDFNLVDHDGKPTRWGVYGPKALNLDPRWAGQRGLNSLELLSYLRTAEHATGNKKYGEAYDRLVNESGYLNNILTPKPQFGPSTGNHSDDEMAFMCFYNLLKYERDPLALRLASQSLYGYWTFLEQPERNPFFNAIFAASFKGGIVSRRGGEQGVPRSCLSDAIDQLQRFPLDRFDWAHANSHRIDIVPIAAGRFGRRGGLRGHLRSGQTVPVDERYFEHWNHDPWRIDMGGDGRVLGDGAAFLLPYYMALYHGFIVERSEADGR